MRMLEGLGRRAVATAGVQSLGMKQAIPTGARASSEVVQHRERPDDHQGMRFEFNEEAWAKINSELKKYPPNWKQSAVLACLDVAQQQNYGHLTVSAMDRVAEVLEMAPIRVYECASFFSMFNRHPVGKYQIHLCGTTPCMLRGKRDIEQRLCEHLRVSMGGTTDDGLFSIKEMECMGSCVTAPQMAIANFSNGVANYWYEYFEDLDPERAVNIVEELRSGKKPQPGPQTSSRRLQEPPGGEATLLQPPPGPTCRDLEAEKKRLEEQQQQQQQ